MGGEMSHVLLALAIIGTVLVAIGGVLGVIAFGCWLYQKGPFY